MASDYRRANYIPPSVDLTALDYLKASYIDLKFSLPASKMFEVTEAFEANLPGIAHEVYNDVGLWWVIALYNGIIDPINDVVKGDKLRLPNLADINAFLNADRNAATSTNTLPTVTL